MIDKLAGWRRHGDMARHLVRFFFLLFFSLVQYISTQYLITNAHMLTAPIKSYKTFVIIDVSIISVTHTSTTNVQFENEDVHNAVEREYKMKKDVYSRGALKDMMTMMMAHDIRTYTD